jgi:hypothetical protein
MTDPRNVAHDKRVQQEKKHRGAGVNPDADETHRPGMKPPQHQHQDPHPGDHGPDPDEPVDKTESGEEP